MELKNVLNKLVEGKDVTAEQTQEFIDLCAKGIVPATQVAAFLVALRQKGETVHEIVGLIHGMKSHMISIPVEHTLDTCGTGGDGKHTFNISTAVALVVAGAGVRVAKHGNRAASSKSGSADVLEALEVHIMLTPKQARTVLEKVGMVFLFAPLYHPVMKHIAPVRKELGIRTVFNFLGPFLSPTNAKRQIIGVPNHATAKKLARVASRLDYEHCLLVTSEDGLDEISIASPTHLIDVKGKTVTEYKITPDEVGLQKGTLDHVIGDDAQTNAVMIEGILKGELGSSRDIVVLNAAAALYVSGKVQTIKAGIPIAQQSIDRGNAQKILEHLQTETKKYA